MLYLKVVRQLTPTGAIVRVTGRNEQGRRLSKTSNDQGKTYWTPSGGRSEAPRISNQNPSAKGLWRHRSNWTSGSTSSPGAGPTKDRICTSGSATRITDAVPVSRPQDLLDGLLSKVAFDPLSFMRLKPAPQAELLRSIAGLDTSKVDKEISGLSTERTIVGRSMLSTPLSARPDPGPAKSVDEATEALERAQEAQRALDEARRDLTAADQRPLRSKGRGRPDLLWTLLRLKTEVVIYSK